MRFVLVTVVVLAAVVAMASLIAVVVGVVVPGWVAERMVVDKEWVN